MANIKFDFSKQKVLITGGGQGIGRKMVEDFLSSKAQVVVWDQSATNLRKLKEDFPSEQLAVQELDISSYKQCEQAAKALTQPIDFLINNAGILRDRSFSKMTWEEYSSVMRTNLDGVFCVTQSLLPHFKKESSCKRIVNISSMVAIYGNFGQSNYVAAKAGVIGFTKVWAKELGRKGWTVNAIAPGYVQTDILKNMPQDVIEGLVKKIPVGRLGQVEDVSKMSLFLCSKEASYINGAVLEVTGGMTA